MMMTKFEHKGILAAAVIAVVPVCLLFFADKAFHIDDPLFIWAGKQAAEKPADFYGFSVNWYGTEMPMHEVTQNPPLATMQGPLGAGFYSDGRGPLPFVFGPNAPDAYLVFKVR